MRNSGKRIRTFVNLILVIRLLCRFNVSQTALSVIIVLATASVREAVLLRINKLSRFATSINGV